MRRGLGAVCDGDVEVRKTARDELRKGAHCIKNMTLWAFSLTVKRLTISAPSQDSKISCTAESLAFRG